MLLSTKDLAPNQRLDLESFFTHSLGLRNLLNDFYIKFSKGALFIAERAVEIDDEFAPNQTPQSRLQRMQGFLDYLKRNHVIRFDTKIKVISNDIDDFTTTHYKIKAIDFEQLAFIARKSRKTFELARPGVDAVIWSDIPKIIKANWHKLSPDMHHHIIESVSANLPMLFAHKLHCQQPTFGDEIKHHFASAHIPVRINEQDRVYELEELLMVAKKERPGSDKRARYLADEGFFRLADIKATTAADQEVTHIAKTELAYRQIAQTPKDQRYFKQPKSTTLPPIAKAALPATNDQAKEKKGSHQAEPIKLPSLGRK